MRSVSPCVLMVIASAAAPALGAEAPESYTSVDEVRAIVSEMLADAETRRSLQGEGASLGHDGHFYLGDASGNFRLQISGLLQFRYTLTFRDNTDTAANPALDGDFESGFTASRTRLVFSGNIVEPNLLYKVSGDFYSQGGEFTLQDAWVAYGFENGMLLLFGQYKMPVLWEDVISSWYSLAVDHSVMDAVLGQDWSQGMWLHQPTEHFRWWGGFSDGIRSANTDYNADGADWALTGRLEGKWAGEWSAFDQFTSPPGSEYAGRACIATHWQDGPSRDGGSSDALLGATDADVFVKGDGWTCYAVGAWLHTDDDAQEYDDFAAMVQGGFYIPGTDKWEPFVRYDVVLADHDRPQSDPFNTLAAGVNYYLYGTAAKFTFDVQYFMDATVDNDLVASIANGEPGSRGTRIGLLPTDDASFTLRFQFQIIF